jgi:hypothetical protein
MTDKKEKSPQEIATEKLAKAYFTSEAAELKTDNIGGKVMYEFLEKQLKSGKLPEVTDETIKEFTEQYHGAVANVWGLKHPLAGMYVEGTHGLSRGLISEAIQKQGFDVATAGTIAKSQPRQQARQRTSSYHFDSLLPKSLDEREELYKSAASESGLTKLLDGKAVAATGGWRQPELEGILNDLAYRKANDQKIDIDQIGANLASNKGYHGLFKANMLDKYLSKLKQ